MDPLYLFVFAGLFTPGPNVILLTASGARFGFRATIPHILGVAFGVGLVAAATAAGIGALLLASPALGGALQIGAAAWILWMAWTLARQGRMGPEADRGRPFSFAEAIAFQAVNPKVWAVALAAAGGYASDLPIHSEALRLATTFSGLNLFVCLFWTWAGTLLSALLTSEARWRMFSLTMAALLAVSSAMVFL